MFQDKINSLKLSKKKLKQKIMITMFIILCTSVTVVSRNPASIIFLLSSLGGIASITWNALSNIKIQKDYLLCNKVLMESFENLIIVFTNINRHILSTNISCF